MDGRKLTKEAAEAVIKNHNGDLVLWNTGYTEFPGGLHIPGCLDLRHTGVRVLPPDLTVGGYIDATGSCLEKISPGLEARSLFLSGTLVRELPDDLKVPGMLDLRDLPVRKLPDGFSVDYLDISGTPMEELPAGLTVRRWLYAACTPLETLPGDFLAGGDADLRGSQVSRLPAGLVIPGSLNLTDTPIRELPAGMVVGGCLDIRRTGIMEIPDTIRIGYIETDIKKIPHGMWLNIGDYVPGRYICTDEGVVPVAEEERIGSYIYYTGKIPKHDVITDGAYFATCLNVATGIEELKIKEEEDQPI